MAGIYIHIPFCKKACHYCSFHFSTNVSRMSEMTQCIVKELELRKTFLENQIIETIYIGGGTPSLLPVSELNQIFEIIVKHYSLSDNIEYTIEANPDDLSQSYLQDLFLHSPVNRLSIGVQSFFDNDLLFMNRAHSSGQSHDAIEMALLTGFTNISIDLIFGNPTGDNTQWLSNLKQTIDYGIPHISAYALTVEEQTALAHQLKKGTVAKIEDKRISEQFEIATDTLTSHGYEHYEISNYGLPNYESRHNSSYWLGKPYLGVGPSAHSYDGTMRYQNVSNNSKYLKHIQNNELFIIEDPLAEHDRYNEYIMTRLRTKWGVDPSDIDKISTTYRKYFEKEVLTFLDKRMITTDHGKYFLTKKGKLFADHISSELFCSL